MWVLGGDSYALGCILMRPYEARLRPQPQLVHCMGYWRIVCGLCTCLTSEQKQKTCYNISNSSISLQLQWSLVALMSLMTIIWFHLICCCLSLRGPKLVLSYSVIIDTGCHISSCHKLDENTCFRSDCGTVVAMTSWQVLNIQALNTIRPTARH